MKLFVFLSFIFMSNAFAHELDYGPYLKMQESLAEDEMDGALEAHKHICDRELIHYKDDYKDCDKPFKDIDELRASFTSLSKVYLENGNKKEFKTLQQAVCPTTNGIWIQKKGKLLNPYM